MNVLVYTENWDGKFKKLSHELVSYAAGVAAMSGGNVTALSIGNVDQDEQGGAAKVNFGGVNFGGVEERSFTNMYLGDDAEAPTNMYLDDNATRAAPYTLASQFQTSLAASSDEDSDGSIKVNTLY